MAFAGTVTRSNLNSATRPFGSQTLLLLSVIRRTSWRRRHSSDAVSMLKSDLAVPVTSTLSCATSAPSAGTFSAVVWAFFWACPRLGTRRSSKNERIGSVLFRTGSAINRTFDSLHSRQPTSPIQSPVDTKNPHFPLLASVPRLVEIEAGGFSKAFLPLTRGWHRVVTRLNTRARERSVARKLARYNPTYFRVAVKEAEVPADCVRPSLRCGSLDFQGRLQVSKFRHLNREEQTHRSFLQRAGEYQGECSGSIILFRLEWRWDLGTRRSRNAVDYDGPDTQRPWGRAIATCPIAPFRLALSTSFANPGREWVPRLANSRAACLGSTGWRPESNIADENRNGKTRERD